MQVIKRSVYSHFSKLVAKILFSMVLICVLVFSGFVVWLNWIEPYQTEKKLLESFGTDDKTVEELLEQERSKLGGESWDCFASDVGVSCKIYIEGDAVTYLWGIDSSGFYPSNRRTLDLCPNMSRGKDFDKYIEKKMKIFQGDQL